MSGLSFNLDILVAHRGLQASYPENTALALNKAIAKGAQYIELDIQFSADCQPVIYHDPDLQRVSHGSGKVWDYSLQQLVKMPAYEPDRLGKRFISETIAPLQALVPILQANPKVTAFVELKEESIAHCGRERMLSEVIQCLSLVKKQVVLISYDYLLVQSARERLWGPVGLVLKEWQDLHSDIVKNIASDYIFVDHEKIPDDFRHPKRDATCLVAYEVDSIEKGKQLLDKGITMLETFELERLS